MNLTKLSPRAAAQTPVKLHLKDPATGELLYDGKDQVTISLLGAESPERENKHNELKLRRAQGEEISDERSGAELLASITTDWNGIGFGSSEAFPFSLENAVKLYLHPDTDWIVEQVGPFARDRRNFLKNRRTT
ncbi:MAG: hypothetical protein JXR13_15070 [Thalassovita sp.]